MVLALFCKKWKTDTVTPLFQSLHWLPIPQRIQYKIMTTMRMLMMMIVMAMAAMRMMRMIVMAMTTTRMSMMMIVMA